MGFWHRNLARALLGERRFEESVTAANDALAVLRASAAAESSTQIVTAQVWLMQAFFGLERWANADRLATEMRAATADAHGARDGRQSDTSGLPAPEKQSARPGARTDRRCGQLPPTRIRGAQRVDGRSARGAGPRASGAGCGTPCPRRLPGRVRECVRAGEDLWRRPAGGGARLLPAPDAARVPGAGARTLCEGRQRHRRGARGPLLPRGRPPAAEHGTAHAD